MNRWIKLAAALVGTAVMSQSSAEAQRAKHVFIVSFDGGKPAVMKVSQMPTTMKLLAEGAGTWEAQTVFPSITLVSHASMLAGVGPAKHKITWNDWIPEKGLIPVTTSFEIAKKKGMVTGCFAGKEKFKHLELPGSLDKFDIPASAAKKVAAAAGKFIEEKKPNLCFIHFADPDSAGHKYGWGSPEQIKAFADSDEALAILVAAIQKAGIEKDSVIIMSADHGGHDKTHGSNSPDDMIIPWIVAGKGVKKGFTITAPVTTFDSAATALWLLGIDIPKEWDGKPVKSAFTK